MSQWAGGGRELRSLAGLVVAEWGTTCWLCHRPIDLDTPRRTPLGLSIDHVIPRSKGGTNALENLRPAHLACNSARGNRPPLRPCRRPAPAVHRIDRRFFV